MKIQTANGGTIDSDSPEYQTYLRLGRLEDATPDVSDPAPYRTLGDVIELERRRREREAKQAMAEETETPVTSENATGR